MIFFSFLPAKRILQAAYDSFVSYPAPDPVNLPE